MHYFITYLKGLAMGAADVVPGVSGGTIAFITGIYDTLLESIRRINPKLFFIWKQHGFKYAFNHIHGFFLLSLLSGIATSIFSLAKLISWLLVAHTVPVWSFFFGLILVSVYHMLKQLSHLSLLNIGFALLGTACAYAITLLAPQSLEVTPFTLVLSGSIAICAMILPGISGSFILLLIGMYAPIIEAVKTHQWNVLSLFLVGCVCGILCFSHLLSWLLARYRDLTIAFLIGLMFGTLPKIWPWKHTLNWVVDAQGQQQPLLQHNVSPWAFEQLTQQPAQWVLALCLMLFAIVLVLGLERVATLSSTKHS